MAQGGRSKEFWLVPKRIGLHQSICFIKGLIEKNFDGKSWSQTNQNTMGAYLKSLGATDTGNNISNQGIRTLVAGIPQYLGFVYKDDSKRIKTINVTNAGHCLLNAHDKDIKVIRNLNANKNDLIITSDIVLEQLIKLQLTNPVVLKDCENVLVFPFRVTQQLLLSLGYLDMEEIALYLLKCKGENEIGYIKTEIETFRQLSPHDRKALVDAFKTTHLGRIALVKAPSARYYISLCETSGIIDAYKESPVNRTGKIAAMKINENSLDIVSHILQSTKGYTPFDFRDDLQLWIDYIGEPTRKCPPIYSLIGNPYANNYILHISNNSKIVFNDVIYPKKQIQIPTFVNEDYKIEVISMDTGKLISTEIIHPNFNNRVFNLPKVNPSSIKEDTIESLTQDILEHCDSRTFTNDINSYLNILLKVEGIDKTQDKSLRGAYLEYYFYQLLSILYNNNVIDYLQWNGHVGRFGLPLAAPGGKTGEPDIIFGINDTHYILELTTIKGRTLQFQAEGASVPDHVRLYASNHPGVNVIGIFSAPIIFERNKNSILATISPYGLEIKCIEIQDLLTILRKGQKDIINEICSR